MSVVRVPIIQSDPLAFTPGVVAVAPVAYDTAIAAMIRQQNSHPRFLRAQQWVVQQQLPDGSWGSTVWHAHDRLVSTLAAILCLCDQPGHQEAMWRALEIVPALLSRLSDDANETIGFELIAPALLDDCAQIGLPVPSNALPVERRRRSRRLRYGVSGTAVFSLEALDHVPQVLAQQISSRGSLFASPAAAAAYLTHYPETPILNTHLTWLMDQCHGGLPAVHPLDSFAAAWTCWHLDMAGLTQDDRLSQLRDWVWRSWTPQGASFSNDFSLINADDTALSMLVQRHQGVEPDISLFAPFMTSVGARCFVSEYDPSVSTNIHILMVLRDALLQPEQVHWVDWILGFLRTAQRSDGLLADKWHASPFYPTSHAILATWQLDDVLCTTLTAGLLNQQHGDGAWGIGGGSAEETAYALMALCGTYQSSYRLPIAMGVAALERFATQPRPALWIGKSLYRPIPVVESAILAAWNMAQERLSMSA